MKTKLILFAVV